MNEYKVSITQKAFTSINEHVLFVRNVSLEAAKSLYEEIMASLKSLNTLPERYPEIPDLRIAGARVRKMSIHDGRYVALYKIDSHTIIVYDVIDTRKDGILNRL